MEFACLDLEGVLVPEIWIGLAEKTGIEALRETTLDVPDFPKLMAQRIELLAEHGLGLRDIEAVIATMTPLEGAVEFLDWLDANFQVVILSDTFYEFAGPLMRQLGWPVLLCHHLEFDDGGSITGYRPRLENHKRAAVSAFKSLNFTVIAAGDSFNDTAMLGEADAGIFIRAPAKITAEFPDFVQTNTFAELRAAFEDARARL